MHQIKKLISIPRQAIRRLTRQAKQLLPAQPVSQVMSQAGDFWRSSVVETNVRDQSHWLGEGRWQDAHQWTAIGHKHFAQVERLRGLAQRATPIRSMLEWGPGGGANAVIFAPHVQTYYGVDISEANLIECHRQLSQRGFTDFRPILIRVQHPTDVLRQINSPLDLILCTAVFQHFPNQAYGRTVLELMHQILTPQGVALIQIRYNDGSRKHQPKHRDYAENWLSFTTYYIEEFWDLTQQIGFTPLAVDLVPRTRYAYFYLVK